ncbi:polyprenol monophosphomannose synthase [Myroides sp. 1354]|uniref:polyprenol monophosphomannose synthase n=1 Tax=unclassified Myroides TaxID=2642485 RepID=UPI0025786565|nr:MULTISPECIES: polyprenol monophosphomannose synthase [unclassified Myroides]MDM1043984.1 polyprenol monophosphomannose synthase [Myroides sp. R163-1]MDM1054919.1 polyprenol monophosphomannose synthase [Myroides sp. 1354]MDM1068216.1 polyprenol monophosphomannose synthase [Myroides sp. 1372]
MNAGLVIIPTYNEIENITQIIEAVLELPECFHVLIVDDNSPDGTAAVVEQLQKKYNSLHLLKRSGKNGLGTAYVDGFKWALQRDYPYIFEMDADFSHNPTDLSRLLASCKAQGGMVIGSRYVTGVNVVNWPLNRVLLSYGASIYVRWITRMPVKDTTAGFVCYAKEVLECIDLDKIRFVGYAFQIEMKYRVYVKQFPITEVPIIFTDRTRGESKMSKGIIKEAIFGVMNLKIRKLLNKL